MRCAICYAPPPDDPLSIAAAQWLGRDAYTGERLEGFGLPGIVESDRAFLTAPVRRYGFHASIKPPFEMSQGETERSLVAALRAFCTGQPLCHVPAMRISLMGDSFALVPAVPCAELEALAATVVTRFDRFRAPMGEAEVSRRAGFNLTEEELNNLWRWGHPFVLEQFRFCLPLTGPVPRSEREHVLSVLEHHFGDLATAPLTVDRLVLFAEPEPYAPFRVHSTYVLAAQANRQTA